MLYLAGEESPQQIRLRGERLAVNGKALYLATDTQLESILVQAERLKPDLLIIDSIQTVHFLTSGVDSRERLSDPGVRRPLHGICQEAPPVDSADRSYQ